MHVSHAFRISLSLAVPHAGKSCLVVRFVRDEFFEYQEPTIGAAFLTQTVNLEDNQTVKFEIWDTAGQERYRSLAPMYYRGAAAAIIVYDVSGGGDGDCALPLAYLYLCISFSPWCQSDPEIDPSFGLV
jgi:hypothetical protein